MSGTRSAGSGTHRCSPTFRMDGSSSSQSSTPPWIPVQRVAWWRRTHRSGSSKRPSPIDRWGSLRDNEAEHRPFRSGFAPRGDPDPAREERMALPNPALTQIPDSYKYGWHDAEQPRTTFKKGTSAEVVAEISRIKGEPEWMTKLRLKAYRHFEARP